MKRNEEAFKAVTRILWDYYQTQLGDTPARVATVVFNTLDKEGFDIVPRKAENV